MTIQEMQKEVFQNKLTKGFNVTDVPKEFCFLYGELGEAFEAWNKKQANLGEELADIAIYLLGLSEILGIDLEKEIENKMQINKDRAYQVVNGVLTKVTK